MPLTPDEAASRRNFGGTFYDDACREIDRMLVNRLPGKFGEWTYNLNDLMKTHQYFDQVVVIRLINIYVSHGWDVRYVNTKKQPRHLVFRSHQR